MHTKRPLIMIAILSQRTSASSMRCVVSIIEECFRCFNILNRLRREIGSTPVVGSSKNSTAGLAKRERAQQSLRLLPPLSWPAYLVLNWVRSSVCLMSSRWNSMS